VVVATKKKKKKPSRLAFPSFSQPGQHKKKATLRTVKKKTTRPNQPKNGMLNCWYKRKTPNSQGPNPVKSNKGDHLNKDKGGVKKKKLGKWATGVNNPRFPGREKTWNKHKTKQGEGQGGTHKGRGHKPVSPNTSGALHRSKEQGATNMEHGNFGKKKKSTMGGGKKKKTGGVNGAQLIAVKTKVGKNRSRGPKGEKKGWNPQKNGGGGGGAVKGGALSLGGGRTEGGGGKK